MIASTPQQILNSPLNTSVSKMQYSFPKSPRFPRDTRAVSTHAFYELPPITAKRTTTLGYGTKYDFTKNAVNNPPPNAYSVPDLFTPPNKKSGYSFGLSRDAMLVTGGQYVGDKNSPGPGAYDTRNINKVVISYTFKGRTTAPEGLTTARTVPGPGAYPLLSTLTPKGKYFVSKFKDSGAPIIPPARSARFPANKQSNDPSPVTYRLEDTINPKGSYYLSKFKSSGVRTFGNAARSSSQSQFHAVPGPGSYRMPSDFGYYEGTSKTENNSPTKRTEDKQ